MGNLVFEAAAGGSTSISGPNTTATNVIAVPDKSGSLVVSATTLDASKAVATDATGVLVSVTNTGSGNNVLATNPILVTPNLGTPSTLVGTNITGTATGLTVGNATNAVNATNATNATNAVNATNSTNTTNIIGGATGSVPYQSSAGATTFLSAGTNGQILTLAAGVPTWATSSSAGDVVGPSSATNNAVPTFDGTTGKLIKNNSGVTISSGVITATGFSGPLTGTASTATNIAGGATGSVPYQTSSGTTTLLVAGSNGQVLTLAAGVPTWAAVGGTGTVTSVGGTGTVNGLTLTGTVTTSGNLTLGGTLNGIGNSQLTNSTISGVSLGSNLFSLTAGTNITFSSGTTYNGSTAITINASGGGGGGTVTSVAGTGTVNGLTLTGTVTSSGSLTLGGTLGSIANSQLTNSSITFGSTAAALGTTVSALNAVSIGATTASTGAFTYISTSSTTSTTPVLSFNASNAPYAAGATISGSFLQHLLQNKSGTVGASTNYVLSNDLGTDSTYYGEFGMNSSVFSSGTPADFFSLNNGIYYSGHDGDITLGSGNGFKTYFAWGTTGQSAHVINASGAIGLNTSITGSTNFGTSGQVLTSAGSGATPTWVTPSGMTYPGAGIPNSTGSAWGTSYTTSGTGTVVALATAPALNTPVVTNYTETLYAPSAGSSFTVSLANGTVQELSLNANGTITLPSSVAGKSFVIIVTYSGAYTLTWAGGSTIKWPGGTAPTASSASGKYDIFTFFCDGTNTYGNSFGLNY